MVSAKDNYRRYDVEPSTTIESAALECITFDYPDSKTNVTYETNEFTSVCPWSGLPDFGRLLITYRPKYTLVELKSLKYYLTSFRNVGILQEHVVNRILDDLVMLLAPESMLIEAWFNDRGGLSTYVRSEYLAS